MLVDLALSQRLEYAEAQACASFVEARARLFPDEGSERIEIAGVSATYDGPQSPSTQTFGLGLRQMPTADEMDRIEAFFRERGAPVLHEVSPIGGVDGDRGAIAMLSGRGYHPAELTSVMFLPLAARQPDSGGYAQIQVSLAKGAELDTWAQTAAEGWCGGSADAEGMRGLLRTSAETSGMHLFLARLDGIPVAAGGVAIHGGVALLAGGSTIREFRNRGAQGALQKARFDYAASLGCDLAMMCAEPGGSSQRNAERRGFRIAYTRIKWRLGL